MDLSHLPPPLHPRYFFLQYNIPSPPPSSSPSPPPSSLTYLDIRHLQNLSYVESVTSPPTNGDTPPLKPNLIEECLTLLPHLECFHRAKMYTSTPSDDNMFTDPTFTRTMNLSLKLFSLAIEAGIEGNLKIGEEDMRRFKDAKVIWEGGDTKIDEGEEIIQETDHESTTTTRSSKRRKKK